VVHLTWTHSLLEQPPWPTTAVYPSFEAWVAEGMRAEHDEFQAERSAVADRPRE
jgi:hypothetical protein